MHLLWTSFCASYSHLAVLQGSGLLTELLGFQAYEHHKQHLQSLPSTPYPLDPLGDNAEVVEPQKVTDEPFAQR